MKELEELFKIKLVNSDPNKMNMELIYQENLPPEANQLEDFVDELKGKENNQQRDPRECIKEAEKRLKFW
jgi:hypothetical protein